jgi:hypothetical protein
MNSPAIVSYGEPSGSLQGKEAIRRYWAIALNRYKHRLAWVASSINMGVHGSAPNFRMGLIPIPAHSATLRFSAKSKEKLPIIKY